MHFQLFKVNSSRKGKIHCANPYPIDNFPHHPIPLSILERAVSVVRDFVNLTFKV